MQPSRILSTAISLALVSAVALATQEPREAQGSIVFATKLCCAGQDIQDGTWLQVTVEAGQDPEPALRRYAIRVRQTHRGVARTTYEKRLGEGGWCHVFYSDVDDGAPAREQAPESRRFLFLWIEGQKSSAYMFGITRETLTPLFEKSEGRGSFTCQGLDGDGVYEIIETDSAWHIRGYPLPKSMLAGLGNAPSGRMIYTLNDHAYRLSRIEPVGTFDSKRKVNP